ncbi:DNA polymerase III subunit delta' [Vibrio ostreicida]|uniref:DNA polymerase III subunit delta' n=1 Tax=Vibrio ostreicida TaxID=526588 RepID=A0ABT8BTM1_9VIBR|nr:DNA polymerase III subunit delta' [Vibrio ostreicida]MDN3610502.1 DNA polymerase III subunit delta' [Vibrio ostreicida]NPD07496.1 DNA polymerase III subunit delta' [Vibrio ostreicida]
MDRLYPWLEHLWQEWQLGLDSERFSNSALLCADEGLGAEQLVERFSRAVMCRNYTSEACGFCHSCQLMLSHTHPDFHRIEPEKVGKAITVEQIRQCNRLAQESSQLSGVRLFVIEPAESMNESAANALLKTLEEPAQTCMFLLVSHRPHQLLPTITSRCQQWHVASPSAEALTVWLNGQTGSSIPAYVAHIHNNAPVKTQQFFDAGSMEKYHQIESEMLAVAAQKGNYAAFAKQLAGEPTEYLKWLWYLMTDAQKVHFGIEQSFSTPRAKELAAKLSYDVLYQQSERLSRLIEQLTEHSGLNTELLILDWLIKFDEETCL